MDREIKPGMALVAVAAGGAKLRMRAVSGVVPGQKFPVVWVCPEAEWRPGGRQRGIPWPAEYVHLATSPHES